MSGVWDWIDREHKKGKIFSVQRIYDELIERGDDLSAWIEARESLFLPPDETTHDGLKLLSEWAIKNYSPEGYSAFLASGDYLLVGHAIGRDFTVVTHERASDSKKKVKIPNACDHFIVDCISPWELLQRENANFILAV